MLLKVRQLEGGGKQKKIEKKMKRKQSYNLTVMLMIVVMKIMEMMIAVIKLMLVIKLIMLVIVVMKLRILITVLRVILVIMLGMLRDQYMQICYALIANTKFKMKDVVSVKAYITVLRQVNMKRKKSP